MSISLSSLQVFITKDYFKCNDKVFNSDNNFYWSFF